MSPARAASNMSIGAEEEAVELRWEELPRSAPEELLLEAEGRHLAKTILCSPIVDGAAELFEAGKFRVNRWVVRKECLREHRPLADASRYGDEDPDPATGERSATSPALTAVESLPLLEPARCRVAVATVESDIIEDDSSAMVSRSLSG